jgi:hypothetical protein
VQLNYGSGAAQDRTAIPRPDLDAGASTGAQPAESVRWGISGHKAYLKRNKQVGDWIAWTKKLSNSGVKFELAYQK